MRTATQPVLALLTLASTMAGMWAWGVLAATLGPSLPGLGIQTCIRLTQALLLLLNFQVSLSGGFGGGGGSQYTNGDPTIGLCYFW